MGNAHTHTEELKSMRNIVDKGGTNASTAQTEITPWTRSEEGDELKVVPSIEAQPIGDHVAGSKANGMDNRGSHERTSDPLKLRSSLDCCLWSLEYLAGSATCGSDKGKSRLPSHPPEG